MCVCVWIPFLFCESGLTYMYYCETRLKAGNVPRVVVEMSKDRVLDEAMEIFDKLLEKQGRRLQEEQRLVVRQKISEEKEKTALYIHLAVDVISKWTSEVKAENSLPKICPNELYVACTRATMLDKY